MRQIPILLSLFVAAVVQVEADIVLLKDGGKREGRIIAEDDESVRLAVMLGTMTAEVSIPRASIERIEMRETRNEAVLKEYRQRLGKMDDGVASDWYQLGLWCESQRHFSRLAKRSFETAIEIDPDHEGARRKLGHAKHEGEWMTQAQIEQVREVPPAPEEAGKKHEEEQDLEGVVEKYLGGTVRSFRERAGEAEAELAAERKLRLEAEKKVELLEERISRLERQLSRSNITVQDRRPVIILRNKKETNAFPILAPRNIDGGGVRSVEVKPLTGAEEEAPVEPEPEGGE